MSVRSSLGSKVWRERERKAKNSRSRRNAFKLLLLLAFKLLKHLLVSSFQLSKLKVTPNLSLANYHKHRDELSSPLNLINQIRFPTFQRFPNAFQMPSKNFPDAFQLFWPGKFTLSWRWATFIIFGSNFEIRCGVLSTIKL